MQQKRLVITSLISVILVSILFIGNTYSIYTSKAPDEEVNVYKTGNLDIEVIGDSIPIENILPTNDENSNKITPYRITVKNNGTVAYKFNVILEETTSSNKINHQYIMTKVGVLDAVALSDCEDNIIKKDVIIFPGTVVDIDIRVWISDNVPNTEMNKSFFAKIKIDGVATQGTNVNVDNSTLADANVVIPESQDSEEEVQLSDNTEKEE